MATGYTLPRFFKSPIYRTVVAVFAACCPGMDPASAELIPGDSVVAPREVGTNHAQAVYKVDPQSHAVTLLSDCGVGSDGFQQATLSDIEVAADRTLVASIVDARILKIDSNTGTTDQAPEATGSMGASAHFNPTATTSTGTSVPVNCVPNVGTTFASGVTTVTCTAQSGNASASSSFKVLVQDTVPPVLTLPGRLRSALTNVSNQPAATDTVSGSVPVHCTPASGSTFAVGPTTVNCQASDGAGNSASASFVVTVTTPDTQSVVANDDVYGDGRKRIRTDDERSQSIEISTARGVIANDLPERGAGRSVTLVAGPTRTEGEGSASVRPQLYKDGAFELKLFAPRSAAMGADRQAAKCGTHKCAYALC